MKKAPSKTNIIGQQMTAPSTVPTMETTQIAGKPSPSRNAYFPAQYTDIPTNEMINQPGLYTSLRSRSQAAITYTIDHGRAAPSTSLRKTLWLPSTGHLIPSLNTYSPVQSLPNFTNSVPIDLQFPPPKRLLTYENIRDHLPLAGFRVPINDSPYICR